jgi:hypothetical protein
MIAQRALEFTIGWRDSPPPGTHPSTLRKQNMLTWDSSKSVAVPMDASELLGLLHPDLLGDTSSDVFTLQNRLETLTEWFGCLLDIQPAVIQQLVVGHSLREIGTSIAHTGAPL